MKNALFLILTLCTVISTANAQYGDDRRSERRGDRRDDKWIDSDALENQALQILENAVHNLKVEITNNGNYGYGNHNGTRGGRGNTSVDLLSMAIGMENSAVSLRQLTRGARTRRNQPSIVREENNLHNLSVGMINAIPNLSRGNSNLIDNILAVVKGVGAVDLALNAPRTSGRDRDDDYLDHPPALEIKGGYCSLSFRNSYNETFMVSGEGFDTSRASSDLYSNCSKLTGTASNISNAAACQSKLVQSKCLDAYEVARVQDSQLSRFTACSMSYKNSYNETFTTNGAGNNMVVALASLWDSCKTVSGRASNIANAEVCRQAIVNQKFSCVVR